MAFDEFKDKHYGVDTRGLVSEVDHPHGSEANKALGYYDDHVSYTEEEAKAILRKIDCRLMPLLAITYGLQFIDKASLSLAVDYGLIIDTKLVGDEYNWLGSGFYFSNLVFEFPLVALMQKFNIAKFMSVNIVLWGIIILCHAATNNFAGLLVCRLFLGMFESTVSPASNIITGRFYTNKEIPFRISCWVSFNGLGNFIGTLVGYGIGHINGKYLPWRYMYIITGVTNFLWGIFLFFYLDSSPSDAKFLTEREKKIAVARIASNKTGISADKKWQLSQVRDALTDPQILLMFCIAIATSMPSGGETNFLTLIIKGFGYDALETVLHLLPVGAVQFLMMLMGGWMLSNIPNGRIYVSMFWTLPCLICSALLWKLPRTNTTGLLISCYFLSSFVVTMITILSLTSSNVAGTTKKNTANAVYFVGSCVGNIAGPFLFKTSQAPTYDDGCLMMIVCFILSIIFLLLLRFYYQWENARRKRKLAVNGSDVISHEEEAEKLGFLDKTDRENPYFMYIY